MEKMISRLNNEKGSAIVIAIMVLVIVSLLGIQSARTSTTEVQIAAIERTAKINFYKAEGAAMEAAQEIENASSEELSGRTEEWLNKNDDVTLTDESQWDYDDNDNNDNAESGTLNKTYFGVVDSGVSQGSSLNMAHSSQLHTFSVFGRCVDSKQSAFIEMGYKKRY